MSLSARFSGVKPYAKDGEEGSSTSSGERHALNAYEDYLLDLARERVEEEIAASAFVRGAWREMRKGRGPRQTGRGTP